MAGLQERAKPRFVSVVSTVNFRMARHPVRIPIYSCCPTVLPRMTHRSRSPFSSKSTNCSASEGKSVRLALFRPPFLLVRQIEDQQIVRGRCTTRSVTMLSRKLQVIRRTRYPKHYAVEALVIVEGSEFLQANPIRVKPHNFVR
jgi:hypothetical protein